MFHISYIKNQINHPIGLALTCQGIIILFLTFTTIIIAVLIILLTLFIIIINFIIFINIINLIERCVPRSSDRLYLRMGLLVGYAQLVRKL